MIHFQPISDCKSKLITDPDTDITYKTVNKWWRSKSKTQILNPKVDIKYYLYTQYNHQNGTELLLNQSDILEGSSYVHSKPLRIVIHGFKNNHTSPLNRAIKNGFVHNHDVNVLIVDWGKAAKRNLFEYATAKYHVPLVGKYVGKFIEWLSENYNENIAELANRTTIVGHSLGAHIAGYAGTYLNGTLDTIVGLDPASTRFFYDVPVNRLNTTDAQHVQVIHTYAYGAVYAFGFRKPIAHADYYPNYGASQPGCNKPDKDVKKTHCSHSRAWIVRQIVKLFLNKFE